MELWQLDVLGNVKLATGMTVSVVTGIDDHSRFCVMAKVVARATARPVCDALLQALNNLGIPEQILTDNGKVFTGRLGKRPAHVLFDRICLNNGIRHLLTAPYSPTTTGKVERFYRTLRKDFFAENSFDTIEVLVNARSSNRQPTEGWSIIRPSTADLFSAPPAPPSRGPIDVGAHGLEPGYPLAQHRKPW